VAKPLGQCPVVTATENVNKNKSRRNIPGQKGAARNNYKKKRMPDYNRENPEV
jgi:hypothetical protein